MKRISSLVVLMVLSLSFLSCGSPDSPDQGLPPSAKVTVNATSQLVSMAVKDAPLPAVLAELGQQAQITVSVPDVMKSARVTLTFENLPLEEALTRVLAGQPYALLYQQNGGREVIAGVRLLAKQEQAPMTDPASSSPPAIAPSQASQSPLTPPPPTGSWGRVASDMSESKIPALSEEVPLEELTRSFAEAQDPASRSTMLEAMADRGEEGSVAPMLTKALTDSDEGVRETALNLLKSSYDPVSLGPLASMAALDTNPEFRSEAMTLMTDQLLMQDRPKEDWATVTAALTRGLSDPDPNVREQAAMLLPELSQTAQPTSKWGGH